MNTILTLGTFDLLHAGHIELFQYCKELAQEPELVTVGLNSDGFVRLYKRAAPVQNWHKRKENIQKYGGVWNIYSNDSNGMALIKKVMPRVIVVGNDWHQRNYLDQIGMTVDLLNEWNITVAYVPRTSGVSTTALKQI